MCGLSRRELAGLVALFLLTLPAVTPRLYSSDEVQYFSYLRSLWFDHDVSFENEYRYFYDRGVARTPGFDETFLQSATPSGRRVNFATLGCAILWAPFYAIADVSTRLARTAGADVAADGFSQPYIAAVTYGSAFYGFLAILLSIGVARRVIGDGIVPALAVWAGTPLLFYMYAAPPYSHACSAFAVALFVAVWLHIRREWSPKGLAMLGASAALMAMVREQDVFFAVGPAIDWALDKGQGTRDKGEAPAARARRQREAPEAPPSEAGAPGARPGRAGVAVRGWGPASADKRGRDKARAILTGLSAFALCFLPQLLAYKAINGHFGPSRLVARKMTWTAPHALEVLFSPEHGFFFWTPLALLGVAGLTALALRETPVHPHARRIGACGLLMVAMQVYVSGSVESWTVAGAFGQRRFVALTALLVLGVATVWRRAATAPAFARYALAAYAALAIWWNVAMMALFGAGLMDRQRIELARNAYDAFVTLPRLAPRIVYRYFAERDSFYQTHAPEVR